MAHDNVYAFCDAKCKVPVVSKETYDADQDAQDERISAIESKNTEQDGRLDAIEQVNAGNRLNSLEEIDAGTRLEQLAQADVSLNAADVSNIETTIDGLDLVIDVTLKSGAKVSDRVPLPIANKTPIIKFTNYTGTIPVTKGCKYSTNGSSWTEVTEDGVVPYTTSFTGWVKYNTVISGSAFTSRTTEAKATYTSATAFPYNDESGGHQNATIAAVEFNNALYVFRGYYDRVYDDSLGHYKGIGYYYAHKYDSNGTVTNLPFFTPNPSSFSIDASAQLESVCTDGNHIWVSITKPTDSSTARGRMGVIDKNDNFTMFDTKITELGESLYYQLIKDMAENGTLYRIYTYSSGSNRRYLVTYDVSGVRSTPLKLSCNVTARSTIFRHNGKIYIMTEKYNDNTYTVLDENLVATTGTYISSSTGGAATCEFNGKFLIIGGIRQTGSTSYSATNGIVELDDNGVFTNIGNAHTSFYNERARFPERGVVATDNHIFLIGGRNTNSILKSYVVLDKNFLSTYKTLSTYNNGTNAGSNTYLNRFIGFKLNGVPYAMLVEDNSRSNCPVLKFDDNDLFTCTLNVPVTEFTEYSIDGARGIATSNGTITKTKSKTQIGDPNLEFEYTFKYENGNVSSS